MSREKREEWLRDVEARQRNVVFPDTAQNEARFWRNLRTGKEPLTTAQRVGLSILAVAVLAIFVNVTLSIADDTGGSRISQILAATLEWGFAFGLIGAFILMIKWGTSRQGRKRR
jgi:hypothetical protein